jgi:predicted dehydrogenase
MKTKRYFAGIVGCGSVGSEFDKVPGKKPIYTHAGAYYYHPKYQLVAGADIDESKLKSFSKKWNVKNVYKDFKEMLIHESLDILSICTAKEQHYQIVKRAVEKGIKIIFCEKPFTGDVKKAEELIKLCARNKILLAINYTRRYTPGHQEVKKLIDRYALGKIQTVNCLYTKGIINNGSHVINLLQFLFGNIKRVQALSPLTKCQEIKVDYNLDLLLYFPGGFSAFVKSLPARYFSLFEIDIIGTLSRIKVTESGFNIRWYNMIKSKVFPGYRELDTQGQEFKSGMEEAMINALENIVDAYEKNTPLWCTGQDGLETIKVIETAIKAARNYKI